MLGAGNPAGDGGEVVLTQLLGGVEVEGAVVGADGVDLPLLQGLPQSVHVALGPGRRGADIFGAFKAGQVVLVLGEGKILGAGLQIDLLASGPGGPSGLQPPLGGQVDHIHRIARLLGQGQPAVHRLGLHNGGVGQGMAGGGELARRLQLGNGGVDEVAVFTVAAHNAALLAHSLDDLVGHLVRNADIGIGQIDLVGGDPLGGHLGNFGDNAGVPVLDGHMEAVVTAGVAVGPGVPLIQGGLEGIPPHRLGKVQHAGGAAGQSRPGAALPVVGGLPDGALVHLKMGVGVDKAGEDQLPGGVDDLAVPHGEGGAYFGDFGSLHPQVGLDRADRAEQSAVLDEDRHKKASFVTAA